MKRRDFLKRLGIIGGAALITPSIGLPWPREEPLPDSGSTVIAGITPSSEVFWRNVPAGAPLELPREEWHFSDIDTKALQEAWKIERPQYGWWGLSDFTAVNWGKGTGEGILYVGSTPLWSVKHGRTMWTPDEELLFPAGMVLRPDPEPRMWSAIVRKPGEPYDEWGMISDATGGRYLRLSNPDQHDLLCSCGSCNVALDRYVQSLGANAQQRYLRDRTKRAEKWFDLITYAPEVEASLPRYNNGHFPGLSQLIPIKENS